MAQVEATTERIVAADAEKVFDALADYTGTRAKLLPEHFSEYEVREGGDGEGTLVHWKLQATSKRVRDCLLEVSEPTDGELVEKAFAPKGLGRIYDAVLDKLAVEVTK